MPAEKLERRLVGKVWGRRDVPDWLGGPSLGDEPLGETWFVDPAGDEAELLVKYLFTSERLSIQVHPGDDAARAAGHRRGKDEAWLVLRAEPEAEIGIGLRESVSEVVLREAVLDGRIEQMIDWRPVKVGDILYSSAGTIHALGAGLTVIEIQQNLDLTYRLYDYGRPRELHLAEGLAAADPSPWTWAYAPRPIAQGREALIEGPAFTLERWSGAEALIGADGPAPAWLIPIGPGSTADGEKLEAGSVWTARGPTRLSVPASSELLLAYVGADVRFS